ncbi:MAG: roadblock/LC7 domain-containing protein [Candidatus Zixiibacteriota bacterium]
MNSGFKGELKGILLVSFFIMVVPLIFFPWDFGLRWDFSLLLHMLIEIFWYVLILTAILYRPSIKQVLTGTVLTFTYRVILGAGFAVLLRIMLSESWSVAIMSGMYGYTPAFLLQVLMSPFVIKSFGGGSMKKKLKTEQELYPQERKIQNAYSPYPPERIFNEKSTGRGFLTGEKDLKSCRVDNLESILHYLKEYSGVKAAILVDEEGLVIAYDASSDQDVEKVASYARCLKEANDQVLGKIGEQTSERINIHTPSLWICLNRIGRFLLVVAADHNTDELLSVRIMQSLATIKRYIQERYQENILKEVEG